MIVLSAGSCAMLLLVMHWQPADVLPSAFLVGNDLKLLIYAVQKVNNLLKLCRHSPQDFICTPAGHTCHTPAQPARGWADLNRQDKQDHAAASSPKTRRLAAVSVPKTRCTAGSLNAYLEHGVLILQNTPAD